jgi:hypothetical protein
MDLSTAFESEFCDFVGDACRGFYRLLRATFRPTSLFPAELCSRPFYNCGFRSAARAAVLHPKNAMALWRDERVSPLRNVECIVAVLGCCPSLSAGRRRRSTPRGPGKQSARSAERRWSIRTLVGPLAPVPAARWPDESRRHDRKPRTSRVPAKSRLRPGYQAAVRSPA